MPTISSYSCTETRHTSKPCEKTSPTRSNPWDCDSPSPKPRWCTWATGSTSSASTSGGNASGGRTNGTSTPHRRATAPVGEGEDPCPDEQEIAAKSRGRASQAQPDLARLDQLLPARGLQTHPQPPVPLRVVAGDPVVTGIASLEVEGRPPPVHYPRWTVETNQGGRDHTVQPRIGTGNPISLPGQHHPQPLDQRHHCLTAATVESPVRGDAHAGFGERPGETDRE